MSQAEVQTSASKNVLAELPAGTIKVKAAVCSTQSGSPGALLLEPLTNESHLPNWLTVAPQQ